MRILSSTGRLGQVVTPSDQTVEDPAAPLAAADNAASVLEQAAVAGEAGAARPAGPVLVADPIDVMRQPGSPALESLTTPLASGPQPANAKQEALWLLERLVPGTGVNNIGVELPVAGTLSVPVLEAALDVLLHRYQVLRTAFCVVDGRLRREVLPAGALPAKVVSIETDAAGREAAVAAFAARPFGLDEWPLLRLGRFHAAEGDTLVVCAHHLIFDTISAGIFFEDLAGAYDAVAAGRPVPAHLLVEVPVGVDPAPSPESIGFWRERLRGFDAGRLELSLDNAAHNEPTVAGGYLEHRLSAEAHEAVGRLARELRAPEAVIFLAAYALLLARHGAGPDLVIGSPVNVRAQQTARAIGYHVNVVPLRVPIGLNAGFRELVVTARTQYLDALAHADVPVDLLLPELPRADASWGSTLFRHLFNYVPGGGLAPVSIGGLCGAPSNVENATSKFDLELVVKGGRDGAVVRGRHSTTHSEADVRRLLDRFDALLVALGGQHDVPVGTLPFWSASDHAVIGASNRTERDEPAPTALEAVAGHARNIPARVAVQDGERAVLYGQLWGAAQRTADRLRQLGVGAGDIVALAGRRGPELAAAVFGVWLAGAAYLPVDPDHPAERIADQLADSGAAAVLVGPDIAVVATDQRAVLPLVRVDDAIDRPPAVATDLVVDPAAPAYLIYTSGSTGRPKATKVSHGNLANLLAHFAAELRATPDDGGLWMTTFAFDMSVLDLFLPLYAGGRLVVAPDEARTDGRVLAGVLRQQRVDLIQATPTSWRLVLDEVGDLLRGMRVICGGEPMPPALARRLVATGCELRNPYGPTETTVWSTSGRIVDPDAPINVGTPIRNTTVFVVDQDGAELPVGVHGELCIAGAGVSLGYLGREQLNAERFGEHPDLGRFYRTGDRARWLADGTLELVGRVDRQIKLRGNRIELGEVEAVLHEYPGVTTAAVVVAGDPSGDAVLTAFVESAAGCELVDPLWRHARARLPRSAVPQEFVVMATLPRTTTEKIDYPALTRLGDERRARTAAPAAGAAGEEASAGDGEDSLVNLLVQLWRRLLNREDLDADANFFVCGGHSLLSAQLVQLVEELCGVRVPLAEVFDLPTPRQLAGMLRTLEAAG